MRPETLSSARAPELVPPAKTRLPEVPSCVAPPLTAWIPLASGSASKVALRTEKRPEPPATLLSANPVMVSALSPVMRIERVPMGLSATWLPENVRRPFMSVRARPGSLLPLPFSTVLPVTLRCRSASLPSRKTPEPLLSTKRLSRMATSPDRVGSPKTACPGNVSDWVALIVRPRTSLSPVRVTAASVAPAISAPWSPPVGEGRVTVPSWVVTR
ncbi:hypothetical protein KBTX_02190 [wastewater metagenome]|uniref:Uncharacterized protein n=2 Tax=unclassified sequences TaxID=12908 RepID=A0A5B8REF4_9ZZZZ|nr:hypothetical protein KBTEX_02190 [uncultured organism]